MVAREAQQTASLVVGRIVKKASHGSSTSSECLAKRLAEGGKAAQLQQMLPTGATVGEFANYFGSIYGKASGKSVLTDFNLSTAAFVADHYFPFDAATRHPSDNDISTMVSDVVNDFNFQKYVKHRADMKMAVDVLLNFEQYSALWKH